VLVDDISNTFYAELAKGAELEAERNGYSTLLANTYTVVRRKASDCIDRLVDSGIDGLILAISAYGEEGDISVFIKRLHAQNRPAIFVGKPFGSIVAPDVEVANELGGYLATRHLIEKGHTRIGIIHGPMGRPQNRVDGYIRALGEAGIAFDPGLVKDGDFRLESGFGGAKYLVGKKVTAIFACNDLMAYGVIQMAMERGIAIPDDLAVVGYDDLAFSSLMPIPLTTVRQPALEIGRTACAKVIEMINAKTISVDDVLFDPELIVRKST
jgi:LacI family transcriptional regulator